MAVKSPNKAPMNRKAEEYYKFELGQIVDRINSLENFRVQLASFFGTANLTTLGIAFSVQKAGIVLIAAAILSLLIIFDVRLRAANVAYYYRGMQLQKRLAPNDPETFLQITPNELANEAQKIAALTTREARKSVLFDVRIAFHSLFVQIPIIVVFGEVVVGLLLWKVFEWSLF